MPKPKKDEPVFVLRAQDQSADVIVELWADMNTAKLGADSPKILAARDIAAKMRAWPKRTLAD